MMHCMQECKKKYVQRATESEGKRKPRATKNSNGPRRRKKTGARKKNGMRLTRDERRSKKNKKQQANRGAVMVVVDTEDVGG